MLNLLPTRDAGWTPRSSTGLALVLTLILSLAMVGSPPRSLAAEEDSFTIAVLPDTQNYAQSATFHSTIGTQTQWVVDNTDDLNIRFTVQLGDLVEHWANHTEWGRVSQHFAVLDNAHVPYAVLMGNHDFNITNGLSQTYDTYFPPSRFADAAWNSDTVSYGGYLGQNQFGPDAIDRQNKDNYALLSAGGLDFLLLQLEFESPQYSLEWAQRVIDAHPDRRVILSTHGFINPQSNRSNTKVRTDTDAKTANEVWQQFVYPNCNIFMVLNGHWSDVDIAEARRTDPNSCGQPVHQILTNYQRRPNGGDGWLRYYTFTPSANTIEAFTYSPTLEEFETDASSQFTLPYSMTTTGSGVTETLIRGGSEWHYRNESGAWLSGWQGTTYNDAGWSAGPAPLGYGSTDVATNIDAGPPASVRPLSMQFRHAFEVEDPEELSEVTITTRADDGVIVYVNGTEVGRRNLPTGSIGAGTYATAAPRTSEATGAATTFSVPVELLLDGSNVVAAATHLNYRGTPDASFDVIMSATRTVGGGPGEPEPEAPVAPTLTGTTQQPDTVQLSWSHPEATHLSGYQLLRNDEPIATPAADQTTYTDTGLTPDTSYTYTLIARGTNGLDSPAANLTLATPPEEPGEPGEPGEPTPVTLVPAGSDWTWLFQSTPWPNNWTTTTFNDTTWATNPAPLGWGHPSIITNIDVPPPTSNRPRTALFRHEFQITDSHQLSEVTITTRADDGVAIWVNGTEVGRAGLPTTGTLSANTYATGAPNTTTAIANPATFAIPTALLHEGTNIVTASNHHNYRGTHDLSFDLTLTATRTVGGGPGEPEPEAPVAPTLTGTTQQPDTVQLSWSHPEATHLSGYQLLRNDEPIATPAADQTTYTDTGLTPDTSYTYTLIARGTNWG